MRSRFKVLGHPLHPILIVFPLGLYPIALVCDLIFLGRFLWDGTIDGFWWGMALWSLIFGGLITALKKRKTRRGDWMAVFMLEDLEGSVEVVVFADIYATAVEHLKGDDPILVTGTLDVGEKANKVIATAIVPFREVLEKGTSRVTLTLKADSLEREVLEW